MTTVSKTITHKPGKVESVIVTDLMGNLIEGKTYKKYAPYLKIINSKSGCDKERWSRNIKICFRHEKRMLELVNSKGLPGVRLIREHGPDMILEMEYVAGNTLFQQLTEELTYIKTYHLITSAFSCIAKHNNAGIVLNDTHPSNFLVSPQGQILFCDYANASSSIEEPFRCPPLTTGSSDQKSYYSAEQDRAFKADHLFDGQRRSAPYAPKQLRTNDLDCKGDLYVLAKHVLELCPKALDRSLLTLLENIKQGKYQSADAVLQELVEIAPKGFYTPEIESPELTPKSNSHKRRRRRSFSFTTWEMSRKAMAAAVVLCLVSGLAVAEMQKGFLQGVINRMDLSATPVQQSSAPQTVQVQAASVQKTAAVLKIDAQKRPEIMLKKPVQQPRQDAKTEPALSITKQAYNKQLIHSPQQKVSNNTQPRNISLLQLAKADAFSANTAVALKGIKSLQRLAKSETPESDQANAAIGKLIEKLENESPSEAGKQRLELLCSYGHVRAHFSLARWLENGKGIDGGRDLAAAYRHYYQAERKISVASEALARLENMAEETAKKLKLGKNSTQQSKVIDDLFQLLVAIAEKSENSKAQFIVGSIYAQGLWGQVRNMDLAAAWLRKSLINGYADAKTRMTEYGIKG